MNREFDEIIKALPDRVPRSRLEAYRNLMEELRRNGRTFREIAEVLDTQCGVRVTRSGGHDFLRRRDGAAPRSTKAASSSPRALNSFPVATIQRIAELKNQPSSLASNADDFQFEPNEPLRILKTTPSVPQK